MIHTENESIGARPSPAPRPLSPHPSPLPALSPASFLARGLRLPPPPAVQPVPVPPGTRCPLTGDALETGYPIQAVIPASTGEWLDLLHGDTHGYFSRDAAATIANDWNLGNRAIIERPDGGFDAYYPLLARPKEGAGDRGEGIGEIAEEQQETEPMSPRKLKNLARDGSLPRPIWSDLLRQLWPAHAGARCLLILATDPKKRVWNRARVGTIGAATPFLVFDSSRHLLRVVTADMEAMLSVLTLVEEIYTAGFSKRAISQSLLREQKPTAKIGHARTLAYERALSALRPMEWFPLVVIVAQRAPVVVPAAVTPPPIPTTPGGLFDA